MALYSYKWTYDSCRGLHIGGSIEHVKSIEQYILYIAAVGTSSKKIRYKRAKTVYLLNK